jgi:hypothetical protein
MDPRREEHAESSCVPLEVKCRPGFSAPDAPTPVQGFFATGVAAGVAEKDPLA